MSRNNLIEDLLAAHALEGADRDQRMAELLADHDLENVHDQVIGEFEAADGVTPEGVARMEALAEISGAITDALNARIEAETRMDTVQATIARQRELLAAQRANRDANRQALASAQQQANDNLPEPPAPTTPTRTPRGPAATATTTTTPKCWRGRS